jgi:hypothetical protein
MIIEIKLKRKYKFFKKFQILNRLLLEYNSSSSLVLLSFYIYKEFNFYIK